MNAKTKVQYKRHKIYKWIALFAKIISKPLLELLLAGAIASSLFQRIFGQTSGTFVATLLSLIIYYAIIFIFNRHNFDTKGSLFKGVAVYILVVIFLLMIESYCQGRLQNTFYGVIYHLEDLSNLNIESAQHPYVYVGLGLGVQLMFSMITGYIIFILYKNVLSNPEVLDKI